MRKREKRNTFTMIFALACANTALYGLPLMKSQFYDIMLEALRLNHTQLSTLFSINGIVCMLAYILGGILTDFFSVKKLMLGALLVSGFLHLFVATVPNYAILCIVFAVLAVTSVLIFYPASMKTLTYLEEDGKRGSVFGNYIAVIDIIGIIIVGIGFFAMMITEESVYIFRIIILLYGVLHFVSAFLIYRLYEEKQGQENSNRIKKSEIAGIISNKKVWGVIALIFSNYLMMSAMTYVIPFLSEVYGMSEQKILVLSIVRVNLIAIVAAPLAGKIVDKIGSAIKLMKVTFVCSAVLVLGLILDFYISVPILAIMLIILLITFAVVSAKSLNLVTLSEIGVPQIYMGTAIGLVSFFGYSPDAFFYSLAGMAIDKYGVAGYKFIFIAFLICSVAGILASAFLLKALENEGN